MVLPSLSSSSVKYKTLHCGIDWKWARKKERNLIRFPYIFKSNQADREKKNVLN